MLKNPLLIIVCTIVLAACSKSESPESPVIPKENLSSAKEISSFKITLENEVYSAIIRNDSILYKLPSNTDLTSLTPEVTYSEKANISPTSGQAVDFTNPVKYTVIAEDQSKKEYSAVLDTYNSETEISSISFPNTNGYSFQAYSQNSADIDTLAYEFSYTTDITSLIAEIEVSQGAAIAPEPGEALDYSSPIKYTITAEDGSTSEILILATNKSLSQLKIEGFLYNQFDDVPIGGDITFSVNELNPYQDSIQVRLFSDQESFDLEIKSVNEDTKEITATLPSEYRNNRFNLEVSIEHDNIDQSDGFKLLKGKLNFIEVKDFYNNGNPIPVETAIWPGQYLDLLVYLKDDVVDSHGFFLLKDGVYYELNQEGTFNSPIGSGVRVEMPDLPDVLPQGGNDYKIVLRNAEREVSFDLTNSIGNNIEVIVAQAPVINSLSHTTVQKGGTLTVMGTNLFIGPFQGYTSSAVTGRSQLLFKKAGSGTYVYSDTLDANGNLVFDLSESLSLQSGTYEVQFSSNVEVYPEVATDLTVTVTQPPSEHPTLQVSNAKLYGNNHASLPKQILLTFNNNIENYEIKRIVTGRQEAVIIESYFLYPTTVLTGALTVDEYNITWRDRDSYVVVQDNGVEYKIYFVLEMEF